MPNMTKYALTLVIVIALCVAVAGLLEFANSRDTAALALTAIMIMYALGMWCLLRGIKKANNA